MHICTQTPTHTFIFPKNCSNVTIAYRIESWRNFLFALSFVHFHAYKSLVCAAAVHSILSRAIYIYFVSAIFFPSHLTLSRCSSFCFVFFFLILFSFSYLFHQIFGIFSVPSHSLLFVGGGGVGVPCMRGYRVYVCTLHKNTKRKNSRATQIK